MQNLFTGVQIQFQEQMFDNSAYNQKFDRPGFRQHMLPEQETSIDRVTRELEGWFNRYGYSWELEWTASLDGVVTMYFSADRLSAIFKEWLEETNHLFISAVYGSFKADRSFSPSKAKSNQITLVHPQSEPVQTETPDQTSDIPEQVYPQEADALVETLGYAQQVEDYEYNDEIGHVYSLKDGSALVVTRCSNGSYVHYLVAETTQGQADALVELVGMTSQVEDHEENERGHVYTLVNGWALVVTAPTSYLIDNGEGQISYHNTGGEVPPPPDQTPKNPGLYDQFKQYTSAYTRSYMETEMVGYDRLAEVCNTVISLGYCSQVIDEQYAQAARVLRDVYQLLTNKQAECLCHCGVQSQVGWVEKTARGLSETDGSIVSLVEYLFPQQQQGK